MRETMRGLLGSWIPRTGRLGGLRCSDNKSETVMKDATRVVRAGLPDVAQGQAFLPGPTFAGTYHLTGSRKVRLISMDAMTIQPGRRMKRQSVNWREPRQPSSSHRA